MLQSTDKKIPFVRFGKESTELYKLIEDLNSGALLIDGISGKGRFEEVTGGNIQG